MPRTGDRSSDATFCAIDLGAQSGRVVLVHAHRESLTTEEISRFPNEPVCHGESLHWDVSRLWREICKALDTLEDRHIDGIGVDAWGVDYALLDARGELLENPYHYRDSRTRGVMEAALQKIAKEEIYRITGIQFMPINTLYQLLAAKRDSPRLLDAARSLITIPDLFHYWLSGTIACEFTNATTTQLLDASIRKWATDLMERLDLPAHLPAAVAEPGTTVGSIRPDITQENLHAPVILPGSHDTASAVAAISARDGTAFLSSGTWSLLGTELEAPVITAEALHQNFTNEGGVNGTTRLLKNVMGLWILERCRDSWASRGEACSHRELMELAGQQPAFQFFIDPDDESFLNPQDMTAAIDQFCARTGQPRAFSPAACARGILEGLAFKYRFVTESLEKLAGRRIEQIRVIGGGSKNRLLNQFTANATGRRVLAGPAEATALGNAAVQMLSTGAVASLEEARAAIDRSFPTEDYEPVDSDRWDDQAKRFQRYCEFAHV